MAKKFWRCDGCDNIWKWYSFLHLLFLFSEEKKFVCNRPSSCARLWTFASTMSGRRFSSAPRIPINPRIVLRWNPPNAVIVWGFYLSICWQPSYWIWYIYSQDIRVFFINFVIINWNWTFILVVTDFWQYFTHQRVYFLYFFPWKFYCESFASQCAILVKRHANKANEKKVDFVLLHCLIVSKIHHAGRFWWIVFICLNREHTAKGHWPGDKGDRGR
jgi:hypothetical protein